MAHDARSRRVCKVESRERLRIHETESRMGARVAQGEGAHVLEVKVGIIAELPTSCEAARPTHC